MNEVHENQVVKIAKDVFSLIGQLIVIIPIFILIFTILFAPALGFYIRGNRIAHYGIGTSSNDPRVRRDMFVVWTVLWAICIAGWIFAIYLEVKPYSWN